MCRSIERVTSPWLATCAAVTDSASLVCSSSVRVAYSAMPPLVW